MQKLHQLQTVILDFPKLIEHTYVTYKKSRYDTDT